MEENGVISSELRSFLKCTRIYEWANKKRLGVGQFAISGWIFTLKDSANLKERD